MFGFGRRKKEKKEVVQTEYSVFITDSFSSEDEAILRPICTMNYMNGNQVDQSILCHVKDGDGQLDLQNAKEMFIEGVEYALKEDVFRGIKVHEDVTEAESHAITEIKKVVSM